MSIKCESDQTAVAVRIGNKIIKRREELGMTATELAIQANLSASQLSLYESGQRTMGVDKLHNIAVALNVPLSYFQAEELDAFSEVPSTFQLLIERLRKLPADKQHMMKTMFMAQIDTLL